MPDTVVTIRSRAASGKHSYSHAISSTVRIINLNPFIIFPVKVWYDRFSEASDSTLTDPLTSNVTDEEDDYGANGEFNPPHVTRPNPQALLQEYGTYASIDIPTPDPAWGNLVDIRWLITGNLVWSARYESLVHLTPGDRAWTLVDSRTYCSVRPAADTDWSVTENFSRAPATVQGDGFDPWVYAVGHPPPYDSYISQGKLPITFHFRDEGDGAACSDVIENRHGGFVSMPWVKARFGTTQSLRFSWDGYHHANIIADPDHPFNTVGEFTRSGVLSLDSQAENFILEMCLVFHKDGTVGRTKHVVADTFNGIVVVGWLSDDNNIWIGKSRAPLSGDVYATQLYGPADAGSQLGLAFLPNGQLVLAYTKGGVSVYSVNKQFGNATAWSAPAALTPDVADMLNVFRGQNQVGTVRIV